MTDQNTDTAAAVAEDSATPETEAADVPTEQVETEEADDGGAEEAPKPKKTAKERIDELTAARRQAERDAEYWREQAIRPQQAQPTAPAPQPQQGRPDPSQYVEGAYDPAYLEDLTTWKAEDIVSRTLSQREAQSSLQSRVMTFEQRVSTAFPDGEPEGLIALRRAPSLPEGVQDIILSSENGPKLADHLGSNPGELRRLSSLTPTQQAYELAKLEHRLNAAPRTTTTAPAPAPTARGTGGRFQVQPDTSDFASFEALAEGILKK